jgi:integrase
MLSIDVSTHAGLRDHALIGLMVYSFARIGAAVGMAVEDVYTQNRRLWMRLREKGGKRGRGTGRLTRSVLPRQNAYAMIRRRAAAAGIETKLGNHSFRATGITAYLRNSGTLEKAAAMHCGALD